VTRLSPAFRVRVWLRESDCVRSFASRIPFGREYSNVGNWFLQIVKRTTQGPGAPRVQCSYRCMGMCMVCVAWHTSWHFQLHDVISGNYNVLGRQCSAWAEGVGQGEAAKQQDRTHCVCVFWCMHGVVCDGSSNVPVLIVIARMYVHGITLLAEWVEAALARVKFGYNQLCLNMTNPAPADLLPLDNFIWRCEVLCTIYKTQWSIEQGSEPQCRSFCHAVT